jgi:Protein of unknown function DUF262
MPPYATLKFDIDSLTVADFRDMNKSGKLVLRPEYQRQAVWPERAKVSLMETILLGYPIPEIYLAYETSPDGDQTISVVDGQQRLAALLDYLENIYALDGLEDKDIIAKYDGTYFRDLPADVRTEFFQYRFPIRRLSNLDEEFVRAIFARVNRVNMVLTEQELRNALLPGPFFDFLKDCAAHNLSIVSGVFSGERRKRGGDLEFYAEVFGTCIFGLSNKKAELNERYDKFSVDFEDYRDRSVAFLEMLTVLAENVKWQGQVRWSNIVDLFTLLHVCWGVRDTLGTASDKNLSEFRSVLDHFQRAVSAYKREDSSGSEELITALSKQLALPEARVTAIVQGYISGIRNSSDLGSRRSRSRELRAVVTRQLKVEDPPRSKSKS